MNRPTELQAVPCAGGCGRHVANVSQSSRLWRDRDPEATAHMAPMSARGLCGPCYAVSMNGGNRRPHRDRVRTPNQIDAAAAERVAERIRARRIAQAERDRQRHHAAIARAETAARRAAPGPLPVSEAERQARAVDVAHGVAVDTAAQAGAESLQIHAGWDRGLSRVLLAFRDGDRAASATIAPNVADPVYPLSVRAAARRLLHQLGVTA